ncbi:MAG: non-homologous end-joining DNA ligase [Acidobacteriaceae bacterium]|nr:non-homologous end-joining DNA ligase [Acidobacteriaceae bacterium]
MPKREVLDVNGRKVQVSNLDKILYPDNHFTKAQVIDYYIRASQYLLPHFHNRPVTLKRFPDGVRGEAFYEKDAPGFTPDWVRTFPVPRRAGGTDIQYILINDLPTLVWCANIASLELHPFLHCAPELNKPTSVVFDLDPGEGANILTCAEVAFLLRDVLAELKLQCWPKVSGSKGIQVYVPLNTAVTYDMTQPFARAVAGLLAKEHPDLIVAEMAKSERPHKVFIDWSQNSDFKTTIGVYSLRAKMGRPFVSLPVSWDELAAARDSKSTSELHWQPDAALERLERTGDLFSPVLSVQQTLPHFDPAAAPAPAAPRRARSTRKQGTNKSPRASAQGSRKRFVVQKHAASHLHYDFRLEMHGVLKSWAVPKGVPLQMNQRRLAMATEDHPLAYLEFEGVIPQGEYGGGTVMVWDIGTYELIEGNYYKGNLRIFLAGKKLKGEWRLTRDRTAQNRNWALIKSDQSMKPLSASREGRSVLSRRTMEEIAADPSVRWHSNRTPIPDLNLDELPVSKMQFIEPMQCKLVTSLPEGENWQYEVKLDGYRALAIKDNGKVDLLSRRNNNLNQRFEPVSAAMERLEDGIILDGEIVALDESGRPSFNLLQHYRTGASKLAYYAFDLLAYRHHELRVLPLSRRRQILEAVLQEALEPIRLSAVFDVAARDVIAAVREQSLEGVIGKDKSTAYLPGDRKGDWVKYKVNQGQELVVGGYKPGGKNHFENLAVGYYDEGRLIFIAKLKNGFTPADKEEIYARLEKLQSRKCPFDNLPEPKNARRGEALTAEAMQKYRWIKPELVVQVEFTDWTAANHLRHSKFAGVRDDKDPREILHETATG